MARRYYAHVDAAFIAPDSEPDGFWTKDVAKHLESIPGDSPAASVARHVLANPSDRVGIAVLLDALQAWLECEPSAERDRERLASEVRAGNQWEYGSDEISDRLRPLLDKLRTLGYGAAVDEYLRPAAPNWEITVPYENLQVTPEGERFFAGLQDATGTVVGPFPPHPGR